MAIFINILLLIIGFVFLIKGADIFVDGASSTARNFNLSKMLIGLTIVAFGTSAPEFAVSVKSMISGSKDMVLGNVIGSNILNILLILGISSMICPLKVKSNTVKKELPITLLITILLSVLFVDNIFEPNMINQISRGDGIVMLLFFTIFIYYLFSIMRNKVDDDIDEDDKPKYTMKKSIIFTLLGIIGIILGSELVVNNAVSLAKSFGVSERVISLTIIAFGTSLPELVTSVVAAMKKEQDILVGNIIGSNIFNIGIVLALPVALFGGIIPIEFNYIDIIGLIVSAILLFLFAQTEYKVTKKEGFIMLAAFIIYYISILK